MKKMLSVWSLIVAIVAVLSGCSESLFSPRTPTVLTMWHVYGGQTDSPMNRLVERFNQSVGQKEGILVNVTSVFTAPDIHFALVAAAKKHPGAADLPDIFTTYPKTPYAIDPELFMDWKEHLSEVELQEYVPSFVSEGEINGRLLLLPVAKSSNALFINATIFDQFSRETGVRYEDLATWEGMFQAAKRYYEWSGGKAFYKYDDWILYGMLNTVALGGEFFKDQKINLQDESFRNVWKQLASSAIDGEVCSLAGYATTAMMTGEVLCGISSTASILYFKDTVTFPDNTTIPLRLAVLPPPYFKDGRRLTLQRGVGLGMLKTSKEKERAAVIFARWLTDVDNNVPFVRETGYFPVKNSAYQHFQKNDFKYESENYQALHAAIQKIHATYEFYIPPFFENYGEVEKQFSAAHIELFKKYQRKRDSADKAVLIQEMLSKLESDMK